MDRLDVVEVMLTAEAYNDNPELDEDDLPPRFRKAAWNGERAIERPLVVTEDFVEEVHGDDGAGEKEAWEAIEGLPFTDRDSIDGTLRFTVTDLAHDWYVDQADEERVSRNPTLAYEFGDEFEVDYDDVVAENRPKESDAEWVHSMVDEILGEGEEAEEMLELVEIFAPEEIDQSLGDIVLTEEQEKEVEKVMKAIEHRDYLREVGLSEIGKLLFVGPPGTGKTSTAKALSGRLELPFIEVKLSMITSQYLGETAKNVDKVFELAKMLSPCILFIDEFDSIAKTRDSDEHAALKRTVNTLLKSIDDISLVRDSVLLIGATNHPKMLDYAAWRRFDEIVEFPAPDEMMRAGILRIITDGVEIEDFDAEELAAETEGLTGSDLRLVLREAVLDALTSDRRMLTQEDLLSAVENFEKRKNLKELDMVDGSSPINGERDRTGSASGPSADHDHDHGHEH